MGQTFGQQVRDRRTARRMTLKELAAASGVSVSMLSQVERGVRVPTLPVSLRIAEGLRCHLSDLLDAPPSEGLGVLRREERSGTVDPASGVKRLLLSGRVPPSVVEVTWYRLPGNATAGPFLHRDADLVEQVTVVAGRIDVMIGKEVHELRTGDSFSFPGAVRHRYRNPLRTESSFVHLAAPRGL